MFVAQVGSERPAEEGRQREVGENRRGWEWGPQPLPPPWWLPQPLQIPGETQRRRRSKENIRLRHGDFRLGREAVLCGRLTVVILEYWKGIMMGSFQNFLAVLGICDILLRIRTSDQCCGSGMFIPDPVS